MNLSPVIDRCEEVVDPLAREGGCEPYVANDVGGDGGSVLWLPCEESMTLVFTLPDIVPDQDIFHIVEEYSRGCEAEPTVITASKMLNGQCMADATSGGSTVETCHIDSSVSLSQWAGTTTCTNGVQGGMWPDAVTHYAQDCWNGDGVVHKCATKQPRTSRWTRMFTDEFCSTTPAAWIMQNKWNMCVTTGHCDLVTLPPSSFNVSGWMTVAPPIKRGYLDSVTRLFKSEPLHLHGDGQDAVVGMLTQLHREESIKPFVRRHAQGKRYSEKRLEKRGIGMNLMQVSECLDGWWGSVKTQDLATTQPGTMYMVMKVFSSDDCSGTFWQDKSVEAASLQVGLKVSEGCFDVVNHPLVDNLGLKSLLPPQTFSMENMTSLSCVNVDAYTGLGNLEYGLGCDGARVVMDAHVCWKPWGSGIPGIAYVPGAGGVKISCLVKLENPSSSTTTEYTSSEVTSTSSEVTSSSSEVTSSSSEVTSTSTEVTTTSDGGATASELLPATMSSLDSQTMPASSIFVESTPLPFTSTVEPIVVTSELFPPPSSAEESTTESNDSTTSESTELTPTSTTESAVQTTTSGAYKLMPFALVILLL